jgi:hypothetical protein
VLLEAVDANTREGRQSDVVSVFKEGGRRRDLDEEIEGNGRDEEISHTLKELANDEIDRTQQNEEP